MKDFHHTSRKVLSKKHIDFLTFAVQESLISLSDFEVESTLRNPDEWHRHNHISPMAEKVRRANELRKNMFYVDIPMSAMPKK